MAQLTYRQAVAAALAQEMARDDRVVLIGEDIASGGVFKTTVSRQHKEELTPEAIREIEFTFEALRPHLQGYALETDVPLSFRPK